MFVLFFLPVGNIVSCGLYDYVLFFCFPIILLFLNLCVITQECDTRSVMYLCSDFTSVDSVDSVDIN